MFIGKQKNKLKMSVWGLTLCNKRKIFGSITRTTTTNKEKKIMLKAH